MNTHQYSATHFERDLAEGANGETPAGLHVQHGVSGLPGNEISLLHSIVILMLYRRILQLRDLAHPNRARREQTVIRTLPHIVSPSL